MKNFTYFNLFLILIGCTYLPKSNCVKATFIIKDRIENEPFNLRVNNSEFKDVKAKKLKTQVSQSGVLDTMNYSTSNVFRDIITDLNPCSTYSIEYIENKNVFCISDDYNATGRITIINNYHEFFRIECPINDIFVFVDPGEKTELEFSLNPLSLKFTAAEAFKNSRKNKNYRGRILFHKIIGIAAFSNQNFEIRCEKDASINVKLIK